MKDIAILLPYKENFTENNAGAASIWVKDYLNRSKLKKRSTVYGNLEDNSKPLLNNFKNLKIGSSFVKKNISYTDKLYKEYLKYHFKIIEIPFKDELRASGFSKTVVNLNLKYLRTKKLQNTLQRRLSIQRKFAKLSRKEMVDF